MMLRSKDLLELATMPLWSDISLGLYKEFSQKYLLSTVFRYHLENGKVLDVHFADWSIYHILGIQHIDGKISKTDFFKEIDNGLDFNHFMTDKRLKKRFNDYKHRIRMFACIYRIMKNEKLFYVERHQLDSSSVAADYIKYALIEQKGVNVGIRLLDGKYMAYTLLVDRSINPTATIDSLVPVRIKKLEIIRNGSVVETVE